MSSFPIGSVTTERDAYYLENLASLRIACHWQADVGRLSQEELREAIHAEAESDRV